ncbi:MAG TPA: MAPEG family protein [Sphingomicrobium sp.]|nr:MAPEG family protein [Sphingomicrobium sp.]
MPHDLQMLAYAAALAIIQMLIAVLAAISQFGLPTLAGNRENLGAYTGLALRAQRAHLNMLENLAIFAIVVIVAEITNRTNETTALGASLFLWGRLAYAVIYLAGIPWLRTAAWAVSIAGILLVMSQLF